MNGYEYIFDGSETNGSGEKVTANQDARSISSHFTGAYTAPLLHGQCISILISGTGFFATLLSSRGSNCPMLLSALNYFCLAFYIITRWTDKGFELHMPWWAYTFVAILDVEANVLVVTAYNYTTITSIMLLDCFSIPCVMVLSFIFLKAEYNRMHMIGVVVCVLGMGCIVLSDALADADSDDSSLNPLKGDILCLAGTFLYACSNVLQETMVKDKDPREFLGMLGLNGVMIATIQMTIFELPKIQSAEWQYDTICFTVGYVMCLFCMYFATSFFLKTSDAALFNLSLLTSDVYAVVFSYCVFGTTVHWLYYIAFALTGSGLIVYSTAGPISSGMKSAIEELRRDVLGTRESYIRQHDDDARIWNYEQSSTDDIIG